MGFYVDGVWLSPNFQCPLAAKLCVRPKSFRAARICSRSSITMPSLVGLGFHLLPGQPKTLSFLSVCCSSRFWTSDIVRLISPWRRWSSETILILLDRGRFVVVHPCSTLSNCCQLATTLNAEVQKIEKMGKNWEFFAARGRQNKPIETKFGT